MKLKKIKEEDKDKIVMVVRIVSTLLIAIGLFIVKIAYDRKPSAFSPGENAIIFVVRMLGCWTMVTNVADLFYDIVRATRKDAEDIIAKFRFGIIVTCICMCLRLLMTSFVEERMPVGTSAFMVRFLVAVFAFFVWLFCCGISTYVKNKRVVL